MFNHVANASRCMIVYPDRVEVGIETNFWISRISDDLRLAVDHWFYVYKHISYLGLVLNLGEFPLSVGRYISSTSLFVIIFSSSATFLSCLKLNLGEIEVIHIFTVILNFLHSSNFPSLSCSVK